MDDPAITICRLSMLILYAYNVEATPRSAEDTEDTKRRGSPRISPSPAPLPRTCRPAASKRVTGCRRSANWRIALGVTVTTVTRGYDEAERRGLIRGEVGRGTFVKPPAFAPPVARIGVIDLGTKPCCHTRTPTNWRRARPRWSRAPSPNAAATTNRTRPPGASRHRRGILRHLKVPADASDTILTCGGATCDGRVARHAHRAGDTVLCESVTYTGMRSLANHLHVRLQGVAMDRRGADLPMRSRTPRSRAAARSSTACPRCRTHRARDVEEAPPGNRARRRAPQSADRRRRRVRISRRGVAVARARSCPSARSTSAAFPRAWCPACGSRSMRMPASWVDRVTGAVFATTVMVPPIESAAAAEWMQNGTVDRVAAWKREEIRARQDIARKILGRIATGAPKASTCGCCCLRAGRPKTSRARRGSAASSSSPVASSPSRGTPRLTPSASASAHPPIAPPLKRALTTLAEFSTTRHRRLALQCEIRFAGSPPRRLQVRAARAALQGGRRSAAFAVLGLKLARGRTAERLQRAKAREPANCYGRTTSSGRRTIMLRSGPWSFGAD